VRELIAEKYTVHDEVFISRLFYGELSARFRAANENNEFAEAVFTDLQQVASNALLLKAATHVTTGLIARVSYHEPQVERFTGGDMGFTVVRPSFAVTARGTDFSSWLHEQGLLCQAKRQSADEEWGSFTKNQKAVLPERMAYAALLLYGYSDESRHMLLPFMWKPCAGYDLDEIESWLDEDTIRRVICAGETAHLKVEITWPGGPPTASDSSPPPTAGLHRDMQKEKLAEIQRQEEYLRRQQQQQYQTRPPMHRYM
jgi:hypothetical protein